MDTSIATAPAAPPLAAAPASAALSGNVSLSLKDLDQLAKDGKLVVHTKPDCLYRDGKTRGPKYYLQLERVFNKITLNVGHPFATDASGHCTVLFKPGPVPTEAGKEPGQYDHLRWNLVLKTEDPGDIAAINSLSSNLRILIAKSPVGQGIPALKMALRDPSDEGSADVLRTTVNFAWKPPNTVNNEKHVSYTINLKMNLPGIPNTTPTLFQYLRVVPVYGPDGTTVIKKKLVFTKKEFSPEILQARMCVPYGEFTVNEIVKVQDKLFLSGYATKVYLFEDNAVPKTRRTIIMDGVEVECEDDEPESTGDASAFDGAGAIGTVAIASGGGGGASGSGGEFDGDGAYGGGSGPMTGFSTSGFRATSGDGGDAAGASTGTGIGINTNAAPVHRTMPDIDAVARAIDDEVLQRLQTAEECLSATHADSGVSATGNANGGNGSDGFAGTAGAAGTSGSAASRKRKPQAA